MFFHVHMFIIFLSFFNSKDVLVFFFFFRFWKSGRLVPSRFDEQFYNNRTRTNIRQKRNAQIYSDFLSNFFNAIALTFLSFFLFVSFSFVMKEPIRVEGHKKFGSWGCVNFFFNFDLSAKQQFGKCYTIFIFSFTLLLFLQIIVDDDFFIRKETIMMEKQD